MKTSIVIPVYNVADFLPACVESVCRLRSEIEVILVDDGSTDGSGELCDTLSRTDSRIRVIHQKNGGLSEARNTGIRNSTGAFLLFLDSDDLLNPEETDQILAGLTPDMQVAMGLYQNYFTEDGHLEPESCTGFGTLRGVVPIARFLEAIPADGKECYMTAWRFVVQREFLLQHELLFLPGIYHEDEEWTQRMICCADSVAVFQNAFYEYRQARAGAIMSSVKPKHLMDSFTIIGRAQSLLQTLPEDSVRAAYLRQRAANLYLNSLILVRSLPAGDRDAVFALLKKYRSFCAPRMTGAVGRCSRICMNLFGTGVTAAALHILRKVQNQRR